MPEKFLIEYLERFRAIPTVSLSMKLEGYHSVLLDNYESSKKLFKQGIDEYKYKKFSYIAGPNGNEEADARFKGVVDGLAEINETISPDFFYQGNFDETDGYNGAKYILKNTENRPEVIVCANDEMALGAMRYMEEQKIKIPEEIAVYGYDDIARARMASVPLTTVRQSFPEKISIAYDILKNKNNNKIIINKCINGKIIRRSSSGRLSEELDAKQILEDKQYYIAKYMESLEGFALTRKLNRRFSTITRREQLRERLETFFNEQKMSELYICLFEDEKRVIGIPEEFLYPKKCFVFLDIIMDIFLNQRSFLQEIYSRNR